MDERSMCEPHSAVLPDHTILFNTNLDIVHALKLSDVGVHTVGEFNAYNAFTPASDHVLPAHLRSSKCCSGERMLSAPMGECTFVSAVEAAATVDTGRFSSDDSDVSGPEREDEFESTSDMDFGGSLYVGGLMPDSSADVAPVPERAFDLRFPFASSDGDFSGAFPLRRVLDSGENMREVAFSVSAEWLVAHGSGDLAATNLFTDNVATHGRIAEPCFIEALDRKGPLQLFQYVAVPVLLDFDTKMLRETKNTARTEQLGYTYVDMGNNLTMVQITPRVPDVVQVNVGVLKLGARQAIVYQSTWFAMSAEADMQGMDDGTAVAPVYAYTAPLADVPVSDALETQETQVVPSRAFSTMKLSDQFEAHKYASFNDGWGRFDVPASQTLAVPAGARVLVQAVIEFHPEQKMSESADDHIVMELMGGTVQVEYARAASQDFKGPFKLWRAQFESPTVQSPSSGMLWWIHNYDAVMAVESHDPYGDLANAIGDAHIRVIHYTDM